MTFPAQPLDSAKVPISSSYVPNSTFIAVRGSPNTNTDSSSNTSTAPMVALDASVSTSGTLQNSQTGNNVGTALNVLGYAGVVFTVNMVGFIGTVTFKASEDGANYDPINVGQANVGPIGSSITTTVATTSIHCYDASIAGYQSVEAVTTGVTGGNVTVTAHAIAINIAPRVINSADLTLISSAAFTTTQTTADQTNLNARGVRVVLDVTVAGTGSVTLEIDAKDAASGKYVAQLTGAAVVTNSTNVYIVYPALTPVANSIVSDVLPHTWRIKVTANNANSVSYSVGASLLA